MNEKTIRAIETALDKGHRVELTRDRDGVLRIRTVTRKEIKI